MEGSLYLRKKKKKIRLFERLILLKTVTFRAAVLARRVKRACSLASNESSVG